MNKESIKQLADFAYDATSLFLPYSSNIPKVDNQSFHRLLWLDLMRARKHPLRDELQHWLLNLKDDYVDENYPQRKVHCTFFNNEPKTLAEIYNYATTFEERKNKRYHKDGMCLFLEECIESNAKNAVKFGIGNCGENASLSFVLLQEYPEVGYEGYPKIDGQKITIEIMYFGDHPDHVFTVIGRDPNSDINDVSTWGENAYIIDPWFERFAHQSHGAVHVLDALKNVDAELGVFDFIFLNQDKLKIVNTSFLGAGHTERWFKKHANAPLLFNWTPRYDFTQEIKENVPWVEEEGSEPALKKMKK